MITRIEIHGFKTLRSTVLDVEPLQAIVGANDTGKSNLFEAILLLSRLAEGDLASATAACRGGPAALFSIGDSQTTVDRILMAVEMLVEPIVEDGWGRSSEIRYTRMRYELEIARREDPGRLAVTHEALIPIQRSDDVWARRSIGRGRDRWLPTLRTGRSVPFISTTRGYGHASTVLLHQDGRGGGMATAAHEAERSVLSTIANTEFPHAFAARAEMRSWRGLRMNPDAIGRSGPGTSTSLSVGPDGGNLAAVLSRMEWAEPGSTSRIGADVARAVSAVRGITLVEDSSHRQTRPEITFADGSRKPLATVAGSTLRLLVLAVLAHDPDARGVVCVEDPEAGFDPSTLHRSMPLLMAIPSDLNGDDTRPLRQVIATSASPEFLQRLVRGLVGDVETPVHRLRSVLIARRDHDGSTTFVPLRPSEQLQLPLDMVDNETVTLAAAVQEMSA